MPDGEGFLRVQAAAGAAARGGPMGQDGPMDQIARHLLIHGRVQGVVYRQNCRRRADRLGVHGWVRNLPDGSVEAHVQGAAEAVQELIDWAHQGPRRAEVSEVEVQDTDLADLHGFEVR